jgi:hypothetical protein
MIERLSKKRLEKIENLFRDPPPDSKTAAARDFGVDLFLLLRWLKLTPQERIEEARERMIFLEEIKRQGEIVRSEK